MTDPQSHPEPQPRPDQAPAHTPTPAPAPTVATVEAMVRAQMSTALGGRRGVIEAAIPGVLFTVIFLVTKDLRLALVVSIVSAVVALAVRVLQRSSVQFVLNSFFSIGLGAVFVRIAASNGGSKSDQALAFFLPGILVSLGYGVILITSCVVGWPAFGFMLGSVTGDPTGWHADRQVVRLCRRLTLLFATPTTIGVLLQGPVYLLGRSHTIDVDLAVALLGILRLGLGWPLRIGAWGAMIWLLARDATPLEESSEAA